MPRSASRCRANKRPPFVLMEQEEEKSRKSIYSSDTPADVTHGKSETCMNIYKAQKDGGLGKKGTFVKGDKNSWGRTISDGVLGGQHAPLLYFYLLGNLDRAPVQVCSLVAVSHSMPLTKNTSTLITNEK